MFPSKIAQAKTLLQLKGWEKVLSSTGNKSTGEYGVLFIKRSHGEVTKLWLNVDTVDRILSAN